MVKQCVKLIQFIRGKEVVYSAQQTFDDSQVVNEFTKHITRASSMCPLTSEVERPAFSFGSLVPRPYILILLE